MQGFPFKLFGETATLGTPLTCYYMLQPELTDYI